MDVKPHSRFLPLVDVGELSGDLVVQLWMEWGRTFGDRRQHSYQAAGWPDASLT
jgi:hypothetical protein